MGQSAKCEEGQVGRANDSFLQRISMSCSAYIVGAMNSFLFTADRFATLTIITTLKSSSVLMVLHMVETSESSKTCVVPVESACLFNISLP
jgi:hypothetical protein